MEKPEIPIRDVKDAATSKASLRVVSDRVAQSYASVLKSARQKNNLSTTEVAESLHISRYIIEALESKRYEKLPAEIYVIGYIRSYAALLGLNPEGLVKDFRQDKEQCGLMETLRHEQERQLVEQARAAKDPVFDKNIRQWVRQISGFMSRMPLSYKLAGLLFFIPLVWFMLQANPETDGTALKSIEQVKVLAADGSVLVSHLLDSQHSQQNQAPVDSVSGSDKVLEPVADLGKDKVTLVFSGTSWVTVRDFERALIHQSRQQKGKVLELSGTAPFYVKLSKASVVDVTFNDQRIDFSEQVSDDDQIHELPLLP